MKIVVESNDIDRLEKVIDEFIELARKEYEKQKESSIKKFSKFGLKALPVFDMYSIRKDNKIYIFSVIPLPTKFIRKRAIKKMSKNILGYLKSKGFDDAKVEVED